ncbi:hypothetical protein [Georgenia sp. SUBG003]|uniref:hypothetical protein n=1 Tax=Georgenia sp. SUBG003 TaxID=1497974 RepID=UPI003AB8240B
MARLVVGTGDEALDYLMHAEVVLRETDLPPAAAAGFAGAALERHLRQLVLQLRGDIEVDGKAAKLTRWADQLKKEGVFTAADVQLVANIQGYRDSAAHGWMERVSANDAAWVIENAREVVRRYPLAGRFP